MEEDTVVKAAPVTRLRRRLSLEQQDDVKSPSTPSKKRSARLAAKPQLELIDENSSDNTPRKGTRKTAAKEVADASEEKPITPARRSARIKSNTSIVLETTLNIDSPRAKRAARRTSQIGSDNEAPNTPVKQTRRTRKDSTSSVDTQETVATNRTTFGESIAEKIQGKGQIFNDVEKNETTQNKSIQKSTRSRTNHNSSKSANGSLEIITVIEIISSEPEKSSKESSSPESIQDVSEHDKEQNSTINITQHENLSESSRNLIENLVTKPIEQSSNINKSTSDIESANNLKNKRPRTMSLSTISQNFKYDSHFYSDNEKMKKRKAENINKPVDSGKKLDSCNSNHNNLLKGNIHNETNIKFAADTQEKKYLLENINQETPVFNFGHDDNDKKNIHYQPNDSSETLKILALPPLTEVKSVIYIDDSDTNSSGKNNKQDYEDQCVPVVVNKFGNENSSSDIIIGIHANQKDISFSSNANGKPLFNNSCEPMDIDETIPSNVSLIDVSHNKIAEEKQHNSPDCKPGLYSSQSDLNSNKSINQSKRNSTSSFSVSQNVEKVEYANKSTLILSQLKDVSTTENSLSKSPKSTNTEILSKSANNDTAKEKEIDKKNLSLDYLTSTPLQQKNLKKLAMQINTSIINNSKCKTKKDTPNKNKLPISKITNNNKDSSDESESEGESSEEISNMIDDEAEEASENYKSGDSQDEDERQHQKENEILEKGQTLTSGEDEYSDDTDYEKDSFIVSSDEEDNELLSGTGDDLSMSDNELTMSKMSKKKYNERKVKEQKKASREMFEARHNKSKSEITKAKKKNRLRLDSSTSDSEEEIKTISKKSKRLRLESTQECSMEPESHETKKANENEHLSESITNDSGTREHEITTTCDVSMLEKEDPLSTKVKSEPQSPLKDLNVTCVPIIDNIEEIQVNTDISVIQTNETSDPLQEASNESNASSISENVEIADNYEALLKELSIDMGDRKIISLDMSSNFTKKNKPNLNEPNIEQLNLTNTKTSKKNNVDNMQEEPQTKQESFITLKRTEGKTNISEANEIAEDQPSLNTSSSKKKKKRNKSLPNVSVAATEKGDSVPMFMDTRRNKSEMDISQPTSAKKKKKNSKSFNDGSDQANDNVNTERDDSTIVFMDSKGNKSETNVSLNTSAKKKKHLASDQANDDINTERDDNITMFIDTKGNRSDTNMSSDTSRKKKKKKMCVDDGPNQANVSLDTSTKKKEKKSSTSDQANDDVITERYDHETMFIDTKGNGSDTNMSLDTSGTKKKKKSVCVDDGPDQANVSLNTSAKKKKKQSTSDQSNDDVITERDDNETMFIDTKDNRSDTNMSSDTSGKKKKKNSICVDERPIQANASLNTSTKKKEKKNSTSDQANDDVITERYDHETMFIDTKGNGSDTNMSLDTSGTKKKKKSVCVDDGPDQANVSLNTSTKKKEKKNPTSDQANDDVITERDDKETMFIDTKGNRTDTNMSLDTSVKKKKKKRICVDDGPNQANESLNTSTKKKKKKNSSSDQANDDIITEGDDNETMFIDTKGNGSGTNMTLDTSGKKKNKKSICFDDGSIQANVSLNTSTKKKEKKSSTSDQANDDVITEGDYNETMFIDTKGNRSDSNMSLDTSGKKNNNKSKCVDDGPDQANVSLNTSTKKKEKKNSTSDQANDDATTEQSDNVTMFMDIKANKSETDMSQTTTAKKKKKKSKSFNDGSDQANDNVTQDGQNDAPLETSYQCHKNLQTTPDGVLMSIDTEGERVDGVDPHTSPSSNAKKKKNKKKKSSASEPGAVDGTCNEPELNEVKNTNKRKRKTSDTLNPEGGSENHLQTLNISKTVNDSLSMGNQKKRQKINQTEVARSEKEDAAIKKHSKKRKRDNDGIEKSAKQLKQSSPDKVNVPRLPTDILNQLDDKPSKETLKAKKSKVVSTSHFVVEKTRTKRNKPSNYLEQSIYLNDSHDEEKPKGHITIPKVLPFVPTASTSDTGFTTKFFINILPKETKFVAQTSNMTGFKNEYLRSKNIKKMGTYEIYKTQRKAKMSKF